MKHRPCDLPGGTLKRAEFRKVPHRWLDMPQKSTGQLKLPLWALELMQDGVAFLCDGGLCQRCGVSSHGTRHPNHPIPFLSPTSSTAKKNGHDTRPSGLQSRGHISFTADAFRDG
jgi:hypothetical protein